MRTCAFSAFRPVFSVDLDHRNISLSPFQDGQFLLLRLIIGFMFCQPIAVANRRGPALPPVNSKPAPLPADDYDDDEYVCPPSPTKTPQVAGFRLTPATTVSHNKQAPYLPAMRLGKPPPAAVVVSSLRTSFK